MFFTKFDPLTPEIVNAALADKGCADGAPCDCLKGKKFIARLEGEYAPEELRYEILDDRTLTVTENGQRFTVPYTAQCFGVMLLLTHRIPDTDRAWHLVIDSCFWTLTAFETWFGVTIPIGLELWGGGEPTGYRDVAREIQRQYSFGWVDFGDNEKPLRPHTTTNRIEGRGLHWDYDTGYEILTFFPSVSCCTFTELGKEMGGITMTNPADYIRIDDRYYIYSRCEVEFSGKFWIEVLDFFDMKAAGMEFGFEADNSFTWRMHRADLEITGDAGHMEPIFNFGDKDPPQLSVKPRKGARYVYRPMDIDVPMSHEEALRHAREEYHIMERDTSSIMDASNALPLCFDLVGKKFKVWPDNEKYAQAPWSGTKGKPWEYWIVSEKTLKWRRGGGKWHEELYKCFEPDKHLYFFSHMVTGDPRYTMISQVVDFDTALTTTVDCGIGNWHSGWESGANVSFGTLEYGDLQAPFARRHHFTDELLGYCFAWAYSDKMNSIHIYSSPESYSWTILQANNSGGATWSSPCFYIKLRPEVYLFQWVEENCNGMQCLVVMNRKIQHDSGFSYGVSKRGFVVNVTGAFQRELGRFDIRKYFDRPGR